MDRIIIDVSKSELDYIREAITNKHVCLMSYFDTCEEDAKNPEPTWEEISSLAETEFEKELTKVTGKKTVFAYRPKNKKAPYGLKKDGTPKKKSGRPTKELF